VNASGNVISFVNPAITADVTASVGAGARVTVSNSLVEIHPAPVPTTSAQIGTSGGDAYNVPGSTNYNADVAIDNIIISNEN
jgi:hypothetical protein